MERLRHQPDRRERLVRLGATVLIILASAFGIKAVAGALADLDNRDYAASSAGIPAQELSGAMKQLGTREQLEDILAEQNREVSEELRRLLNPGPKQFP